MPEETAPVWQNGFARVLSEGIRAIANGLSECDFRLPITRKKTKKNKR